MRKLVICFTLFFISSVFNIGAMEKYSDARIVSLDEFIKNVCKNDPAFQFILSDKLTLEYDKILSVPVEKLFLEAAGSYGVDFEFNHYPNLKTSIKKLMPYSGSSLEAYLEAGYYGNYRKDALGITYNIEFIKNAFGRTHGLYHKKAKMAEDIALFQILQSYESYLSKLILYYYDWLKSYNKMLAANLSYQEALKLLENVEKKKKWYIAYQVDVDKAKLQAVDKKELLRSAEEEFKNTSIQIAFSFGDSLNVKIIPDIENYTFTKAESAESLATSMSFDSTRSGEIFKTMQDMDSLEILLAMEDLLPSLTGWGNFEFGERDGDVLGNTIVSTGVTLSLPFKKTHENAKIEKIKEERKQVAINASNVKEALLLNLAQLASDISFDKESIAISEERLELSEKIFEAEVKDYQSGRSSLNDLIQAQNTIQNNRVVKFNTGIDLAKKRVMILEALDILVTEIEE